MRQLVLGTSFVMAGAVSHAAPPDRVDPSKAAKTFEKPVHPSSTLTGPLVIKPKTPLKDAEKKISLHVREIEVVGSTIFNDQ